ncbi:MAG: hypothetical protein JWO60_577 [Frankiales bacterium]|nr:hypothetical protein [Frankiales bacterium]
MRALLVVALLLPLSGCGGGGGATRPSSTPAGPAPALVLRGNGLALVTGDQTRELPFGSGMSDVVPAVTAALGAPQPLAVRCPRGIRDTIGVDGFDVLFDGDRMVGWDDSGAGLPADGGLRLGSTRADVVRVLPGTTFRTTSLGLEFSSPTGLAGFLDGALPTSRVVGLTGGESCAVR